MAIENKILTFGGNKIGTVGGNKLMGIKPEFPPLFKNPYSFSHYFEVLDVSKKQNTNTLPYSAITYDTSFSDVANPISDAVKGVNECAYSTPNNSPWIYKVDLNTNVVTRFAHGVSGTALYLGGVSYKNLIIKAPFNAPSIMIIDTANNDDITFTGNLIGTFKYGKPKLASNGFIYFPSYFANHWVKLNPETFDIELINLPLVNTEQYQNCIEIVDAGDGFLYALTQGNNKTIYKLNISTNVFTQITASASIRCGAGVLLNDRIIIPCEEIDGVIRVININTDVVTTISAPNMSCRHALIGADGLVYMPQFGAIGGVSYRYNYDTNGIQQYSNTVSNGGVAGFILDKFGYAHMFPLVMATGFRKIATTTETVDLSINQTCTRLFN